MNKIIVVFPMREKELSISVYQFIDELYRYVSPTIICHITSEEYDKMKEQLLSSGKLKERDTSDVEQEQLGYNPSRYMLTPTRVENELLLSDYEHPDKQGSYLLKRGTLSYDENGLQVTNDPILSKSLKNFNWKYKVCNSSLITSSSLIPSKYFIKPLRLFP